MSDERFVDALGHEIRVGDIVAFGARDGNVGTTKIAQVVSIEWVDPRSIGNYYAKASTVPHVGVRRFKSSRYGDAASRVAYPTPKNLIRLNYTPEEVGLEPADSPSP